MATRTSFGVFGLRASASQRGLCLSDHLPACRESAIERSESGGVFQFSANAPTTAGSRSSWASMSARLAEGVFGWCAKLSPVKSRCVSRSASLGSRHQNSTIDFNSSDEARAVTARLSNSRGVGSCCINGSPSLGMDTSPWERYAVFRQLAEDCRNSCRLAGDRLSPLSPLADMLTPSGTKKARAPRVSCHSSPGRLLTAPPSLWRRGDPQTAGAPPTSRCSSTAPGPRAPGNLGARRRRRVRSRGMEPTRGASPQMGWRPCRNAHRDARRSMGCRGGRQRTQRVDPHPRTHAGRGDRATPQDRRSPKPTTLSGHKSAMSQETRARTHVPMSGGSRWACHCRVFGDDYPNYHTWFSRPFAEPAVRAGHRDGPRPAEGHRDRVRLGPHRSTGPVLGRSAVGLTP